MFAKASPTVSSRPWIAAVIALGLMMSLSAVIAPAAADGPDFGTVEFVDPPEDFLFADPDDPENVTFVVAVSGDFHINATTLAGGVSGIDVTVELTAPDDPSLVIASATEPTGPGPDSATASVSISLDGVAPGFYGVHATSWLVDLEGVAVLTLDRDTIGPLGYDPNGSTCSESPCRDSNEDGTSVTLEFDGDGAAILSLLGQQLSADACGNGYTPLPETVFFDIVTDGALTAEIRVDLTRSARQLEQNNGISQYQFCYIGGAPFDDRVGDPAPNIVGGYPGYPKLQYGPALLPECSANGEVAPCVRERESRGGGAQFTFLVPTGDPMFR